MDDKELKELLRKMGIEDTDGSYRIDPVTGEIKKVGWFTESYTGYRIDKDTGEIKKVGWFTESYTGYRIDKETGKIKKMGWFTDHDTGVRVEKESGRVVKDGPCLIATACAKAMHLPDDCIELKVLRAFRDTYVRNLSDGDALILEYYSIAPRIVKAIEGEANAHEIYAQLYKQLVLKTVELISARKYEEAFANCFMIITNMKRRYLE
ncbi:MAG: hypothetical protein HPY57_01415 [Ignavibacteria bacterium]|nr:hypothetical protein [Ignavibacteria bacterium]